MSCPDWRSLTAWRRGDGAAPPGWSAAVEHLSGCARCRQTAAQLDPTLLLVAASAVAPEPAAAEAESLRATVHSLRRSARIEARSRPDRGPLVAAAAVVMLLAAPLGVRWLSPVAPGPAPPPAARRAAAPDAGDEPLIEDVLPSRARIYQFGSEDLPVVLIVDEALDL